MLEKYHKLQPKPKAKVALQTIWEELPQEHVNKVVANFTKPLTAYMAVAASGGYPTICSNSIRLKVCILMSSPTNWLFSEPPTDYR